MTIRHGNRTRTRPGRRQTHSVKRDHFAFHIMLPRSRLSRGHRGSKHPGLASWSTWLYPRSVVYPHSRTSQLLDFIPRRVQSLSHGIADHVDVDIRRPSTTRPILFVLGFFFVLSRKEGGHGVVCEDTETRPTISLSRASLSEIESESLFCCEEKVTYLVAFCLFRFR